MMIMKETGGWILCGSENVNDGMTRLMGEKGLQVVGSL